MLEGDIREAKPPALRRWLVRLSAGAAMVIVVIAVTKWVLTPQPIPVKTVRANYGLVEETVTNSRAGTVMARKRAKLSPEIGGRVVVIHHRKGDRVKAGELLLQLNDAPQQAKLSLTKQDHAVALAKRDQACLEAHRAHREYRRHKELSSKEFVSQDLLDNLQSTSRSSAAGCRAAEVTIDRAEAAIQEVEAELAKTRLRAPFDGVIAELDTEVGEWTTPAPPAVPIPPIIDLIDPSSLYVSAPMDEVDWARLHTSQQVRISLDPYPDQHFAGRISRIAPYVLDVEEQNRTVEIEVEFADKEFASRLLPGTSADVEVILSVRENVLRVPTPTVLEGNKVFVVDNGHLDEVLVQTGLRNWDYVEVTDGLSEGQAVVTSLDLPELAPGVPVHVQDE